MSASKDPVSGAVQKAKVFFKTMDRRLVEKGRQPAKVIETKYNKRYVYSYRKHICELSADAQKLSMALQKVRTCNLVGVIEEDVLSLDVAVHIGRAIIMDYEMKSYFKEKWLG